MFTSKRCRLLLLPLLCVALFCCKAPRQIFATADISRAFLAQTLAFDRKSANPADSAMEVRIYKTEFAEERVENNDVLEYALRNQSGGNHSVPYLPQTAGYREVLYLLHVVGGKRNDVWAYFSVWYARETKQIGFGPAYRGVANEFRHTIQFDRSMSMKAANGNLYLKRGSAGDFLFAADALAGDTIRVDRIVLEEPNKIGGIKPFVFRVGEHFRDIPYLPFAYDTTITFH